MTITPEAPTLSIPVDVRFTPAGTPLAVRYDGKIWAVDPALESAHWYTSDAWWETRRTVPVGIGNVVDIEHWQVQVASSNSALRTFLLRREPTSTQWLLDAITVTDAS